MTNKFLQKAMKRTCFLVATLGAALPAIAQDEVAQPGRTVEVSGTALGERQSRERSAANIDPIRRISNRIENRVPNRIHNRIDRYHDSQADVTSSFERAAERTENFIRRPRQR